MRVSYHFHVVLQVHVRDDAAETQHAHELEQPEQLQSRCVAFVRDDRLRVSGACVPQRSCRMAPWRGSRSRSDSLRVSARARTDVVLRDELRVVDFVACLLVDERRAEADDDVEQEEEVDDGVGDDEDPRVHHCRLERHVEGDREAVPRGEQHDEEIPAHAHGVVDAEEAATTLLVQELRLLVEFRFLEPCVWCHGVSFGGSARLVFDAVSTGECGLDSVWRHDRVSFGWRQLEGGGHGAVGCWVVGAVLEGEAWLEGS